MSMTVRRSVSLASAVLVAATALSGAAMPPSPLSQASGHRDASGLLIVSGDEKVVPEVLRDAYGMAATLSEENPEDFGVPVIAAGEKVMLPAVGPSAMGLAAASTPTTTRRALDSYLAAETSATSSRTAEGGKGLASLMTAGERAIFASTVAVVPGGRSRAETFAVSDAVFDLQFDARYRTARIWQSEVDPLDGSVLLSVESLTPTLAQKIVASFGVDTVRIRIAPQPEAWPASRPHDTSPYYGGALIGTPTGICTSGLAWQSGSSRMMVSAGHCYPIGGKVQIDGTTIGTVASGSRENWTNGTGTVHLTGSSTYRGDISLISMSTGKSSASRMYVGSSTSSSSVAVAEMWTRSPVAGDQYCTGGSQSGAICGWKVSNAGVNFTYSTGEVLRNGVKASPKQGWCIRPGDSGGPVYTVRADGRVAAKGIISGGGGGGGDHYGGLLDKCSQLFTDIRQAHYAFPGALQTS